MFRSKRKCSELANMKIKHSIYNDTSLDGIEFLNEQNKRQSKCYYEHPTCITTVELDNNSLIFRIKIDEVPSELIHAKQEIETLILLNK